MATFGENLRKYRKEAGLTQQQLADRIGCTRGLISQYEKGITNPSLESVIKIAKALSVKMDALEHIRLGGRSIDGFCKVKVYNCPEDTGQYIVARLSNGELWYWGTYEDESEAIEVADEFENGLVVMRDVQ